MNWDEHICSKMMRLFCRLELQPRHKPKHKRSTNEACVLTRDAKEQSQHRACHCSLQATGCRIDLPPSACLLVWSLSLYPYLCKVRMGIGVMRWLPDGYHCSILSSVSPGRHTGPEIRCGLEISAKEVQMYLMSAEEEDGVEVIETWANVYSP